MRSLDGGKMKVKRKSRGDCLHPLLQPGMLPKQPVGDVLQYESTGDYEYQGGYL